MILTEDERNEVKRQLKDFVKRCTTNPQESAAVDRPSPAEIGILPRIVEILLEIG